MSIDQPSLTPPPQRMGAFGMWLFLAALFMLFASSMFGYAIIRLRHPTPIELPRLLWLSTALIVLSSLTLHLSLSAIRQERQGAFRTRLLITDFLAIGFLAIQTPCMIRLLATHGVNQATGLGLYGLVFFLIALHALHVLGGVVALARVTSKGLRGLYDSQSHDSVRYLLMYWHFLDAVWLLMFAMLLIIR